MSVADQSTPKPRPIHALTGMRFFAALVVVLIHSTQRATGYGMWGPFATNAVTFFFVLSGFILTYVYHDRLWKIGTPKFYVARIARVWPLHVACLGLVIWVDWYFGQGRFLRDLDWLNLGTHLSLLHSWVPIMNWGMRYNGPAWSISTELGFYLLFPLMLLIANRSKWGFGKLLLGCLAFSIVSILALQLAVNSGTMLWPLAVEVGYINPLIRAFDFAAGMWVAGLYLKRSKSSDLPVTSSVLKDSVFEVLALSLLAFLFFLVAYGTDPAIPCWF